VIISATHARREKLLGGFFYNKLLKIEPYKTLFKLSRKTLDEAVGFKESDISSIKNLTKRHKDLFSIFFDI
jgi:hypothetical protein